MQVKRNKQSNYNYNLNNYEQTRQQLTAPKARHGLVALHSAQVRAESACMVDKEKQETNQLKIYNETRTRI